MRREEIKNLLLSFTAEDFFKNVDLHIHSNESDGKMSPYEIVEQAKAQGKKYIAICDHNTIDAYLSTNILREEIVIPSVEFDCFYKGVLIHILGYGIDIDNKEIKSLFATSHNAKTHNFFRLFHLRNPKEVIEKINNAGGVAVLAHPCCCWCFNLDTFVKGLVKMGLEGLETYYPYNGLRGMLKFHSRETVIKVAEQNNLIKTGGTDSHGLNLL
ncbi:MAG: PHP domain-containing protein [Candidatus Gastranaerophilales bacterium]|nr:PHP domain-containing protein [Candidatus Gastranaerophilales bacterium]